MLYIACIIKRTENILAFWALLYKNPSSGDRSWDCFEHVRVHIINSEACPFPYARNSEMYAGSSANNVQA